MALSHRPIAPALALILLASVCSAAMAQTPTRDEPFPVVLNARHWGPFLVDPRLTIDNIGYDDNVFLVSSNSGIPQETDYVVRLGPDVRAQVGFGRRMMLTLHEKLGAEVFLKHSSLNHADNTFDGQFDLMLGPVLLTTEGHWSTQRWRPNSELVNRVREEDISAAETARLFVGPFTDVAIRAARYRFRYSDTGFTYPIVNATGTELIGVSLSDALDRDQDDVSVEIGWRPRPRTRLFVRAGQRTSHFQTSEFGRDSRERRRMIGVEFSPSSRLSGRIAIGRSKLEPLDARRPIAPYDDTVAETLVMYRPTGSTQVTLGLDRQPYFSTFENNLYFVSTSRSAALASYLGTFWGVQAGYTRTDSAYPERSFGPQPPAGQRRRDQIDDYYGGVLFRLRGGYEIGLRIGHRHRDSNNLFAIDDQRYLATSGTYVF